MVMQIDPSDLISQLPLERTWLEDIVEVMRRRPHGKADIDTIANEIMKTTRDVGRAPKETITRTINDWCINSGDLVRKPHAHVFERTGTATYRLLTFPNAPDLIELQEIRFSDYSYTRTWETFVKKVKSNPKWAEMTKRQRLTAFAKNLASNDWLRELLKSYEQATHMPLAL
jgi:hypothetical protein